MGTQLDMLLVGEDEHYLHQLWCEVEMQVRHLEQVMSRFDPQSELYRINQAAQRGVAAPSDELWSILSRAFDYYHTSRGYFDITLGRLSFVDIDYDSHTISFKDKSIYLDLGGYGKGLTLTHIENIVKRSGIANAFVSFGNSSILALGHHPKSDCWSISTNNPYTKEAVDSFNLRDVTLTVSGESPSRSRHIINPHKGVYNSERKMVAIVSRDPVLGEVLSTAGVLMSDEEFKQIASNLDIVEYKVTKL